MTCNTGYIFIYRSCDVDLGSRDPVSESCDQGSRAVDQCVSLSDEQCKALYNGEVEKHLVWAVEKWCQWVEGEREGEGEKIFHFLHLTAELCLLTRQVSLTLHCQLYSQWMIIFPYSSIWH